MKFLWRFVLAFAVFQHLEASSSSVAVPWTKSFLEVRPSVAWESLSVVPRHAHSRRSSDGTLLLSSSWYPDLEMDVGLSSSACADTKCSVRLEQQLASDLVNAPIAITAVGAASVSSRARARDLVFFEMAKEEVELGLGFGRHLFTRKETYTQLFGYVFAGLGSQDSRWMSEELGVQQTIMSHRVRISVARTDTFGRNHGHFHGVGSEKTAFFTGSLSYTYRFATGLELSVSGLRRVSSGKLFSRASQWLVSLSFPLSF
jgi:hypothetical protein